MFLELIDSILRSRLQKLFSGSGSSSTSTDYTRYIWGSYRSRSSYHTSASSSSSDHSDIFC